MSHQQERGIAPIWIVLSIIVIGIVTVFIYGIVNRPPNQHIGNGKPWNEHMSQGSADAKNVFIDYTDYFCSFCAQVEDATSSDSFKNDYIKSGKLRYEHRIVTLLKDKVPNTEQGAKAAFCAADQDKYWQDINGNTQKALSLDVNGLPYMVINDYQTSGFAGGENGLKAILKAGGVN